MSKPLLRHPKFCSDLVFVLLKCSKEAMDGGGWSAQAGHRKGGNTRYNPVVAGLGHCLSIGLPVAIVDIANPS